MRVLILGATGPLGGALAAHLHARGHAVVGVSRRRAEAFERHPEYGWIQGDLHRDLEPEAWLRKLHGFDAVLNCAGLRRESAHAHFETVHALGPAALYRACERAGVRRVVHLTPAGDPAAKRSHCAREPPLRRAQAPVARARLGGARVPGRYRAAGALRGARRRPREPRGGAPPAHARAAQAAAPLRRRLPDLPP